MIELKELLSLDFLGMQNWKWLTLTAVTVSLYFARSVIVLICLKIKKAQAHFHDKSFFQFFLEQKIEKPISWVIISSAGFVVLEYLNLPEGLSKYLVFGVKLLLTVNIIRLCYLAADAFGQSLEEWAAHTENQIDDQLAPFASRTLKVTVIVVGALIGLQNFGVNVTALLAGLGIGGVALAFAAQDTVSNVFGTITIILDRPFKLGDAIKIGDVEGSIYEVGFRSTRIKTYYNSIVSIPNSVVAKEKIDNLSQRDGWIRFRHVIGFSYDAKLPQLTAFCENLKYQLLQDATIDRDRIYVHLNSFGDSSMNVMVIFHYTLTDNKTDMQKISDYLELIYRVSEQNKLSFAFPTRTLIVAQNGKI